MKRNLILISVMFNFVAFGLFWGLPVSPFIHAAHAAKNNEAVAKVIVHLNHTHTEFHLVKRKSDYWIEFKSNHYGKKQIPLTHANAKFIASRLQKLEKGKSDEFLGCYGNKLEAEFKKTDGKRGYFATCVRSENKDRQILSQVIDLLSDYVILAH